MDEWWWSDSGIDGKNQFDFDSWWKTKFQTRHSVGKLVDVLLQSLPLRHKLVLDEIETVAEQFTTKFGSIDGQSEIIYCIVQFSLMINSAGLNLAFVRKENRGTGLGSILFENLLTAADLLGIRKFTVSTGLDDGAYFWAKMGFVPHDDDWSAIRQMVPRLLLNLAIDQPDRIDANTMDFVRMALDSDSANGIRALAALSGLVQSLVRYENGSRMSVTLGRALLCDTGYHWSGFLDLDDDATLEHLRNRVRSET